MNPLPPNTVHGARLEVHQHGPRHVLGRARLGVVHVDPLQLAEERVRMSGAVEMGMMEMRIMEMMRMVKSLLKILLRNMHLIAFLW